MDPLAELSLLASHLLDKDDQVRGVRPTYPHIPTHSHHQSCSIVPQSDTHLLLVTCKTPVPRISFNHLQPPTFTGYVKSPLDAALLVEAVVTRTLPLVRITEHMSCIALDSGTVCVMRRDEGEACLGIMEKNGCSRWSFGIKQGLFMLYREVEPVSSALKWSGDENEGLPRLIPDGLCKKAIPIIGSDGIEYLVVGYYKARDVVHFYTRPPYPVSIDSAQNTHISRPSPQRVDALLIPSETSFLAHLMSRVDPSLIPVAHSYIPPLKPHSHFPLFTDLTVSGCTCPESLKETRLSDGDLGTGNSSRIEIAKLVWTECLIHNDSWSPERLYDDEDEEKEAEMG